MAVLASNSPSSNSLAAKSDHFSISNLISRFRSKRRRSSLNVQDPRPPLKYSPLPLVLQEDQGTLGKWGWTVVTFPQPSQPKESSQPTRISHPLPTELTPESQEISLEDDAPGIHPLQKASATLFAASQAFFDLPDEEKARWKTRLGSEEGWSKIPGEKEFITLRTLSYTPDVLKGPAKQYWDLMGLYLDNCLGRINGSLGLSDEQDQGMRTFVGPCKRLGEEEKDKTATLLRLFRYEGWEEKVVAEPHADLGLLSIVVGDVPGLEVWNGERWVAIEKKYTAGGQATLLGGRQLERLSNYRYPAGGHRVISYGQPKTQDSPKGGNEAPPKYRYSIVFVLRAYEPAIVDSDSLETEITGTWVHPVRGASAGEMYEAIRKAHFNINTNLKEREEQRIKLAKEKAGVKGTG